MSDCITEKIRERHRERPDSTSTCDASPHSSGRELACIYTAYDVIIECQEVD